MRLVYTVSLALMLAACSQTPTTQPPQAPGGPPVGAPMGAPPTGDPPAGGGPGGAPPMGGPDGAPPMGGTDGVPAAPPLDPNGAPQPTPAAGGPAPTFAGNECCCLLKHEKVDEYRWGPRSACKADDATTTAACNDKDQDACK